MSNTYEALYFLAGVFLGILSSLIRTRYREINSQLQEDGGALEKIKKLLLDKEPHIKLDENTDNWEAWEREKQKKENKP